MIGNSFLKLIIIIIALSQKYSLKILTGSSIYYQIEINFTKENMKLLFCTELTSVGDSAALYASANSNLNSIVKVISPNSIELVETHSPIADVQSLLDKDFWKALFSILRENADVNFNLSS